ncbi:AsmA family protein [Luteimonas vadosa]
MNPPTPARKRPLDLAADHPWWTILAALALVVAVLILFWDWNWFKGPIERRVEARTGRSFDIGGNLDVALGRVTTIRADALSFGNADWSEDPMMAALDRLELQFEPLPLLFKGEVRIPEVRLQRPRLRLEAAPGGKGGNWDFVEVDEDGEPPRLDRLWIEDGQLRYLNAARETDVTLDVASRPADKPGDAPPVAIVGGGRWSGNTFTVEGRAESPLELRDTDQPYRIDLHAQAGATRAHARGNLINPFRIRDFDLQLALAGANLADLYPLIGVATPDTPPYSLDGRLTRDRAGDRVTWHYDDFGGKVGDSDLGGKASVTTGGDRPFLRANLVSKQLDFDDLAGFVGAAPDAGRGETTNAELKAKASERAARAKVLPDTPYELGKLRAMDADVRWKVGRINAPSLPLDDMDAHLFLDNGLLRLDPLNFGVAGGNLRSTIRMDARESPIRTDAQISARRLELNKLLPNLELARDAVGRVGGDIRVTGTGNSIARMLATADGDIALGMGRGQVSNLLMELAGLDIYEALKFLIGKDRKIAIRCAFGDFDVKDGIMHARALAFDTTDTIIVGKGQVSLRDETLDLELRPRPKDRSILSLRSPLVASGTFKDPSFRPDMARLGLRGAIALALGSITPPAALLATLELGPGEDSACGGQYAK